MRVLFVKLTSIGDLIHALPAITDAARIIPDLSFDWVIEKNFSEVALWHPAVQRIIHTSHRLWRKKLWLSLQNKEIQSCIKSIREKKYDLIIDGQTSIKSAIVTRLARGPRHGMDSHSSREWLAHFAYQKSYFVDRKLHAIQRLRLLFAQIFNYPCPKSFPDYGILGYAFPSLTFTLPEPYLVFVHNASWSSKLWPERYWRELISYAADDGYNVVLPWGNDFERQRAEHLSVGFSHVKVLPFCTLSEQAKILRNSKGAICSDTGLSHLAAALNVPAVTLYGSTSTQLIGTTGLQQQHFISPFACTMCYKQQCNYGNQIHSEPLCLLEIKPEMIWENFKRL
jgi:heptosyltransferase-1